MYYKVRIWQSLRGHAPRERGTAPYSTRSQLDLFDYNDALLDSR